MPSVTAKLEFSVDPLSDTTPAWTDVTRYCQPMSWFGGVQKDTDPPEAGGATFVLKNLQRRFEPEYTAGAYYPNIVPGRRFRVTVIADGVNYAQGIYYAREWKVEYPDASLGYSVVTVACSDGFWRLSQDTTGQVDPTSAESYADVVMADEPFAYYQVNEGKGSKMTAAVGPEGVYKGIPNWGSQTSAALGDSSPGMLWQTGTQGLYGRARVDDGGIWRDSGEVTAEVVINHISGAATSQIYFTGPQKVSAGVPLFQIASDAAFVTAGVSTSVSVNYSGGNLGAGRHHIALTYDGAASRVYIDGILDGTTQGNIQLLLADDNEFLRVSSPGLASDLDHVVSHAAVYTYALSATRIAAHATAALSRGYDTATAGTRIAALAADPLWSTAGIPAGTVTVEATPQHGQPVIDEIISAHSAELPGSLFYFNDAGNPAYKSLLDTWTVAATFGDSGAEIAYSQIDLAYDDDLFNTATVSGDGLAGATASNAQSLADYGNRGIDASSLPITKQTDAQLLAQTYVDRFSTPQFRCESITLNGQDADARLQILTRELGDVIRVRRRGDGGVPIDIITRILRKEKSVDVNGNLLCTWSLARGFNATLAQWHLSTTGFGELGQTTTLA